MITKDELFQGLRDLSDERKLEFIEAEMKKGMPTEIKILALTLMAEIYEKKRWHNSAAKNYNSAAELAPTFKEKIDLYFKTALMFLQATDYFGADDNFRKVLVLASNEQKTELQEKINSLYIEQAENFKKEKYYTKAIKAFSKILSLKISTQKAIDTYDKLSFLYEKIGKPAEAIQMIAHKKALVEAEEENIRKRQEIEAKEKEITEKIKEF